MWRKRTLRTLILVTTIVALCVSSTVLVHAADGIDAEKIVNEITEYINSFKNDTGIAFYPSEDEELKSEDLYLNDENELATGIVVEEMAQPIGETYEAEEYVEFNSAPEVPTIVQTLPDDDPLVIKLEEVHEDGTCVYSFKGAPYTIPYNPVGNEPKVSTTGYVEKITEVPHYLQQSYPYNNYGNHGTISSHGCGITSCAMVYSYLLDRVILPDELAATYGRFNTKVGSDYRLFSQTAEDFGIEVKMVYNWKEVEEALKNGQVVIANVQSDSIFTDGGHYIVYYGITEDGRILIKDPSIYNYGQWSGKALTEGFRDGFDQKYCKYSFPCWIYEVKDIEKCD